jgi:CRP-like cAMP-binding protein
MRRRDEYLGAVTFAVTCITLTRLNHPPITSVAEHIFAIFLLVSGISHYFFILSTLELLQSRMQLPSAMTNVQMESVHRFCLNNKIPRMLQRHIENYFHGQFLSKRFVGEARILAEMPATLRTEVLLALKAGVLHDVPLLKRLENSNLVEDLMLQLKPQLCLRGEHVITEGEFGREMFILSEGQMAVIVNGRKVAELQSGAFFGEIALIFGVRRTASISALTICSFFSLSKLQLEAMLTEYPAERELFLRQVKEFMEESANPSKPGLRKKSDVAASGASVMDLLRATASAPVSDLAPVSEDAPPSEGTSAESLPKGSQSKDRKESVYGTMAVDDDDEAIEGNESTAFGMKVLGESSMNKMNKIVPASKITETMLDQRGRINLTASGRRRTTFFHGNSIKRNSIAWVLLHETESFWRTRIWSRWVPVQFRIRKKEWMLDLFFAPAMVLTVIHASTKLVLEASGCRDKIFSDRFVMIIDTVLDVAFVLSAIRFLLISEVWADPSCFSSDAPATDCMLLCSTT